MLNPRQIIIPAAACICVAACVNNPLSAPPARHSSTGPLFDGGHMLGSGAFVDSATTATTTDAATADTMGRGGHMLGSGA